MPRYAHLRDALLATIDAGHWTAGDRLPTEIELCKVVPYSLETVQRALRALVAEGVVNRVQGSGTYVAALHGKIDDVVHCRFLADDGESFLPMFSHFVARVAAKSAGAWNAHFSGAGVKLVRLDRILNVNGVPRMELAQSFIIAAIPRAIGTHLGVAKGAVGGTLEGVGRARGNDVVYFQQIFFPPSPRRRVP